MKIRLEKHTVCAICLTLNYCECDIDRETIILEFEMCDCCGKPIDDSPAETPYNDKMFSEYSRKP